MYQGITCTLTLVPQPVLLEIFQFLLPDQLAKLARVCKLFKELVDKDILWKALCYRENLVYSDIGITNWKQYYFNYSTRLLLNKIRCIEKPIVEVQEEAFYLFNELWSIKGTPSLEDKDKHTILIKYRQQEKLKIETNFATERVDFSENNGILFMRSLTSGQRQGWILKNGQLEELENSLYDFNSRWLLFEIDKTLVIKNRDLAEICTFSNFDRDQDGQLINTVVLDGDCFSFFKSADSILNFYNLDQIAKEASLDPKPFLSVSTEKPLYGFGNFLVAYVEKGDLETTLTLINCDTNKKGKIFLADPLIPEEFNRSVQDVQIFGTTLFCKTEKLFRIIDLNRGEVLLTQAVCEGFNSFVFQKQQRVLTEEYKNNQWLGCLRDYKDPRNVVEIGSVDRWLRSESFVITATSQTRRIALWNLVNLQQIRSLELPELDFVTRRIFFNRNQIQIGGDKKTLYLTYDIYKKADTARKSGSDYVETKNKRRRKEIL